MNDSHNERTSRPANAHRERPEGAPDEAAALRKNMDDAVAVAEYYLRRTAAAQRAQFHGD